MILTRLDVRRVRNVVEARLELAEGLIAIVGENGSGKTSLLEAIYLLGTGQSFRTVRTNHVVSHGAEDLVVFGIGRDDGQEWRVGVRRDRKGGREILIDGRKEETRGRLAKLLPMAVITPDSQELISGGPGERRGYLDWLLFHVEQNFHKEWTVYQRAVKQRNELLKVRGVRAGKELDVWEEVIGSAGTAISAKRRAAVEALEKRLVRHCAALDPEVGEVRLRYQPGWPVEQALRERLAADRERDAAVGYTSHGPHRADLKVLANAAAAGDALSRGQVKALVVAMKLAAVEEVVVAGGKRPIVLFDDLPSELDEVKRKAVLDTLEAFGCQVFVTATDASLLPFRANPPALFHVEQGVVKKLV